MKKLKQERFILIIALLISFTMHFVYGLEGAAQVGALEYKLDRQAVKIKDKQREIEIKDVVIDSQSKLIKKLTEQVDWQSFKPKKTYIGEYTITAYCPCEKCCGKYALNRPNGIVTGAAGIELKQGVSVASPLPFGTRVLIDGKEYISQDRTSEWVAKKYDNKIIDIYFDKHEDAEAFGKRTAKVYIVED